MPRVFKGGGLAGVFQRQGEYVGAVGNQRGAAQCYVFAAHADAGGGGVHVKVWLGFQAAFEEFCLAKGIGAGAVEFFVALFLVGNAVIGGDNAAHVKPCAEHLV